MTMLLFIFSLFLLIISANVCYSSNPGLLRSSRTISNDDEEIMNIDKNIFNHHYRPQEENKNSQIIGGQEVQQGRYEYQVGIMTTPDIYNYSFCGGSLISPNWVLTAAHCVASGYADSVHIGRHNYTNESEGYEEIKVKRGIVHPAYNAAYKDYDFALLELTNSSTYSPVKLDRNGTKTCSLKYEDPLTTIGWGVTSLGGNMSFVLREVEVGYYPNILCSLPYLFLGGATESMLCARSNGKDACQGDSGGPLIIKGFNASSDVQVGIVSWGIGCAFKLFPGVYSRVSQGISFIENYVDDLL